MRKGYIFTDKKTSSRAVMAVILGVISLVSVAAAVFSVYLNGGEASEKYGFVGLLSMIYAFAGLILGIVTAAEKEHFKFFPVLGILLNAAVLVGMGLMLLYGSELV